MKKAHSIFLFILFLFCFPANIACSQNTNLKLIFIRHAEKTDDGDNLNCQGLNRSMLLPVVLIKKFGRPNRVYVPRPNLGETTKRVRMLQTITPFAVKYNININSEYAETDYKNISKALLNEKGTIIIVWEHNNIKPILKSLGIKTDSLHWPDNDFDSIWVITFSKGSATLTKDSEGLSPSPNCSF
jgi:hypothetical protein